MTPRYDGLGNPLETVDPLNRGTIMLYDRRGRLIQTVYADDSSKRARYDAMNRVTNASSPRPGTCFASLSDSVKPFFTISQPSAGCTVMRIP